MSPMHVFANATTYMVMKISSFGRYVEGGKQKGHAINDMPFLVYEEINYLLFFILINERVTSLLR